MRSSTSHDTLAVASSSVRCIRKFFVIVLIASLGGSVIASLGCATAASQGKLAQTMAGIDGRVTLLEKKTDGINSSIGSVSKSLDDVISKMTVTDSVTGSSIDRISKHLRESDNLVNDLRSKNADTAADIGMMKSLIAALSGKMEKNAFDIKELGAQLTNIHADQEKTVATLDRISARLDAMPGFDSRISSLEETSLKIGTTLAENAKITNDQGRLIGTFGVTLKNTATQVTELRSSIESTGKNIDAITQRLENLENYNKSTQQQTREEQLADKLREDLSKSTGGDRSKLNPESSSLYQQAMAEYLRGETRTSRDKFEKFIKKYPRDSLVPNAYFWIGEAYYKEKDFRSALKYFDGIKRDYPDSTKVGDSIYKEGLCLVKLGQKKYAVTILEEFIHKYPRNDNIPNARTLLRKLR